MARRLALFTLIALIAGVGLLAFGHGLSWATVGREVDGWRTFARAEPALAALIYVGVYASLVALSLPVAGLILTVVGGALFGALVGGALAVTAASSGALVLFLLARGVLRTLIGQRLEPVIGRFHPALSRDGFSALLALRLFPLVPFWVMNLVPALVGMRAGPFMAATVLGIAPAGFVLASVGAGAGDLLARGQKPDVTILLSPPVLLPLSGLAALSLAPAVWRRVRTRRA